MSCYAILENLYEPKMDVMLKAEIDGDDKTCVLRPTLQTRTCIGVL